MVTWFLPAKDDLKKIFDYISRDSKYMNDAGNIACLASVAKIHLPRNA